MGGKCSIGTVVVAVGKPKFSQRNETYNADFNRIRSSLMETTTGKILYGLHDIDGASDIIIVDGETDKLAVCQLSNLHLSMKSVLFYVLGSMHDIWDENEDGIWRAPKIQNPAYKGPWKPKVDGETDKLAVCQLSNLHLSMKSVLFYVLGSMHDIWDENEDGIWRAPKIQNPAYKGPWKPKHDIWDENEDGIWRAPKIQNPAYKGPWKPKAINKDLSYRAACGPKYRVLSPAIMMGRGITSYGESQPSTGLQQETDVHSGMTGKSKLKVDEHAFSLVVLVYGGGGKLMLDSID
ncbi:calreticulin 3 [Artemisia annua]|uniref:Calreticulin 3 n=1 Tax=Artemisia annua TaxID=35608 RepID=A0A2U1KTN0_ARTAN|nr:calreticulin 3 [Artemisia annua]